MRTRKTDILDVASRKLAPYMFLFGFYLVSYGDVSPGGGFQGGVVIASGIILIAMAKGADAAIGYFPTTTLALSEAITFALLIAAGIGGALIGAGFLADFLVGLDTPLLRTPFIFVLNVLIGVKVAAGVSLICLYLFGEAE
ncbi:MAG: MnhB domain-containing protein [Spirochaetota bacterium]